MFFLTLRNAVDRSGPTAGEQAGYAGLHQVGGRGACLTGAQRDGGVHAQVAEHVVGVVRRRLRERRQHQQVGAAQRRLVDGPRVRRQRRRPAHVRHLTTDTTVCQT